MGILIVDNSPEIIDRIEELLTENRIPSTYYRAASGPEAELIIKNTILKTILLDMNLRGNESSLLLQKIKESGNPVIVIAMSVYMNDQLKIQYKRLGVDYIMDKFYDFEKLPSLIRQLTSTEKIETKYKINGDKSLP